MTDELVRLASLVGTDSKKAEKKFIEYALVWCEREIEKSRITFLEEQIADIEEIMLLARKDKRKNISWLNAWLKDDKHELAELKNKGEKS